MHTKLKEYYFEEVQDARQLRKFGSNGKHAEQGCFLVCRNTRRQHLNPILQIENPENPTETYCLGSDFREWMCVQLTQILRSNQSRTTAVFRILVFAMLVRENIVEFYPDVSMSEDAFEFLSVFKVEFFKSWGVDDGDLELDL